MSEVDTTPRAVAFVLRIGGAVALLAAATGTFTTGRVSRTAGAVAVAAVVAAPLVRVGLLGGHWWRIGDRRFALAAGVLLLVTASGGLLALL